MITPAFAAQYAAIWRKPSIPATDAVLRIAPPRFINSGKRVFAAKEDALKIDVDRAIPFLLGQQMRAAGETDAGVVVEDVEPAEAAHRLRHHPLGVGAFRYVGHNRDRFAAAFRDLRSYRARVVPGAVDHRDLRPFRRKNQRGGASDSRSASSN